MYVVIIHSLVTISWKGFIWTLAAHMHPAAYYYDSMPFLVIHFSHEISQDKENVA